MDRTQDSKTKSSVSCVGFVILALLSLCNLFWNFEVLWTENALNLKDVSAFLKITLQK